MREKQVTGRKRRCKGWCSALLAGSMILAAAVPAMGAQTDSPESFFPAEDLSSSLAERNFTDVNTGDWFYGAVHSVVDKGFFSGVSETKFAPRDSMTRGMFVQVLANFSENYEKPGEEEPNHFLDVGEEDWYYGPVQWAVRHGIAAGKGGGRFAPNDRVTRQEMVVMLFQYAMMTGEKTVIQGDALAKYRDGGRVADWAQAAFRWSVCQNIVVGVDAYNLSPESTSTRAQVAAVFHNADQVMKKRVVKERQLGLAEDAFGISQLDLLKQAFGEILSTQGDVRTTVLKPATGAGVDFGYCYDHLAEYPEVKAYVWGKKPTGSDTLSALSIPLRWMTEDLAGKTAGEAYALFDYRAKLERNSFAEGISRELTAIYPDVTYFIFYETQEYRYYIPLNNETMRILADAQVLVQVRRGTAQTAVPQDLTMGLVYDGAQICKLNLTEAYRGAYVLEKRKNHPADTQSGLYFYEPIIAGRYGPGQAAQVFALELKETKEEDLPKGEAIGKETPDKEDPNMVTRHLKNLRVKGKSYQLTARIRVGKYAGDRIDEGVSYTIMQGDVNRILEGLTIQPGVEVIGE